MEAIKKFLKTRKGKTIVVSLVVGLTGLTVSTEAIEAAVTLLTALGW